MALVILPTSEIIRDLESFDEMFSFYDNGIRGIVRDNVLQSDLSHISEVPVLRTNAIPHWIQKLNDRIVFEYTNSHQAIRQHYLENTSDTLYVELVAEYVNALVFEMLKTLFVQSHLDIQTTGWRWIGNDLLIRVTHNKDFNNESQFLSSTNYIKVTERNYLRHS